MANGTVQQPMLHIVIPQGAITDTDMKDIARILARNGCSIERMPGNRSNRKEINMEKAYADLDNGMRMEDLLKKLNVTYQTLSRRHKEYQESIPEGKRRTDLVRFKETGRHPVDIPMEWVYDQIDGGCTVKEIAGRLHVGTRTLYSRHKEYQEKLIKEGRETSPYKRENLTKKSNCQGRGRKKIEVDMEAAYDSLISGKGICEVAKEMGISSVTLQAHHEEYQKQHEGESSVYIRRRLKDFKSGVKMGARPYECSI